MYHYSRVSCSSLCPHPAAPPLHNIHTQCNPIALTTVTAGWCLEWGTIAAVKWGTVAAVKDCLLLFMSLQMWHRHDNMVPSCFGDVTLPYPSSHLPTSSSPSIIPPLTFPHPSHFPSPLLSLTFPHPSSPSLITCTLPFHLLPAIAHRQC